MTSSAQFGKETGSDGSFQRQQSAFRSWITTESGTDWRLFTTLARFDAVYVGHFKCNVRRIQDYPNISRYLNTLLEVPGVRDTVNLDHIKRHYYVTHEKINPHRIVPVGPAEVF